MSVWAIVVACGKDQEIAADADVPFLALGQRPVLAHSLQTLHQCDLIDGISLVVKKARIDNSLHMIRTFGFRKVKSLVAGSGQRLASLKKTYDQVPDGATTIVIHDASRPFVAPDVVTETIKAGKRYGAAVAAYRSPNAVKLAEKGQKVSKVLDRNMVWIVQSPQAFKQDVFEKMLKSGGKLLDDESALLEKTRQGIHLVVSTAMNTKIRTAEDLEYATALANLIHC